LTLMVRSGVSVPVATVVLRLPASPAHVRTARLVAAAMARRSGVDESMLDEVRLAVGEACARAVRQHERFSLSEPITLEFGDKGRFSVAVIDRAPATGRPTRHLTPPAPTGSEAAAAPSIAAAGSVPPDTSAAPVSPGNTADAGDSPSSGDTGPAASGDVRASGVGASLADIRGMLASEGEEPGWQGLAATADALGLALLDAVAQEVVVTEADIGTGTCITMSWPLGT
jgi:anti-sigma regulatory factor (Ser/Thr protein kinase)